MARKKHTYTLTKPAFYTAFSGLNLLSLAICDTAVRVEAAILQNPNLIGGASIPALRSVFGGLIILCGGVLLIDYKARH